MALRLLAFTIVLALTVFGQGLCRDGYGTAQCPLTRQLATAQIKPVFTPSGWNTVALDRIIFVMPDYRKEAAFYIALMGWKLRSDDGMQAVLDIGGWGSAVFKQAPDGAKATVDAICWVIEPWNAKTVEAELRGRGMTPIPVNDSNGFESFHAKDPNGFDLQISNSNFLADARKTRATEKTSAPVALIAPFAPTGWSTVWLDHLSYNAANYKEAASFYTNRPRMERNIRRRQPARVDDRRTRRHHCPRRQPE
jgi:catechol 2,3-dioxygenase-like lactoylglutathione lyase family enzyme